MFVTLKLLSAWLFYFFHLSFWFPWLLVLSQIIKYKNGTELKRINLSAVFFHSCLNIRCHNHHIRTKLGKLQDCVISRFVTRGTMRPSHFQNRDGVWSNFSIDGCCKSYIWVTRRSLSVSLLLVSMSHGRIPLVLHEPSHILKLRSSHRLWVCLDPGWCRALRFLMSCGSSLSDWLLFVERLIGSFIYTTALFCFLQLFATVIVLSPVRSTPPPAHLSNLTSHLSTQSRPAETKLPNWTLEQSKSKTVMAETCCNKFQSYSQVQVEKPKVPQRIMGTPLLKYLHNNIKEAETLKRKIICCSPWVTIETWLTW